MRLSSKLFEKNTPDIGGLSCCRLQLDKQIKTCCEVQVTRKLLNSKLNIGFFNLCLAYSVHIEMALIHNINVVYRPIF